MCKSATASICNSNISFDNFNLGFLSPLGKEAIKNIGGKLTGDVNLWGPIQELKHDGILSLQNAQFSIPYLNINYQANETDVRLSNQDFVFRDVNLFETEEKTSATLGGTFSHVNFRNWSTQLNIESSRMLLLNTPQLEESLFFGQGFLNGKLSLSGPTKNLKISLQGATEPGTAIKIPWAENYGLSDSSFVQFIDKNNREIKSSTDQEKLLKEISGLELDFELDVTNNASIEINQNELNNITHWENLYYDGNQYEIPYHNYSEDLDVLGPNSLYSRINRSKSCVFILPDQPLFSLAICTLF